MKKLISAIIMCLISAVMFASSTYAWFSMNTHVTVTGMQIQAKAESGIVIANETECLVKTGWKASTTATFNTLVELTPTSTADTETWYHNNSSASGEHEAANDYETLAIVRDATTGVGYVDATTGSSGVYEPEVEKAYYLLNKFYIKSSAEEIAITETTKFYINKIAVETPNTSAVLDASLRVAVVINGNVYIYAPVTLASISYTVAGSAAVTATACSTNSGIVNTAVDSVTVIPNSQVDAGDAIVASVFVYFEGEDENCMSDNITADLDQLRISVIFGIEPIV